MCLPVDLCSKTPDPELNDGEYPTFTVDDCFKQSECINQFGEHLTKEHNLECLLSYIEFKQFERYILDQINNSDVELMCMALKMRSELEVRNRKYKFKNYKRCIVGEDAIKWLTDRGHCCSRQQAVDLFCDFIRNGLLLCCIPDAHKKEQALYKFLWDVVDVDSIETPLADAVPASYIVHSNEWNTEQKAYQIYRKYVETKSDLEINVSDQIKKMFAKYVDDLDETFHDVGALRLLDLFDTLRLEMKLYLQHSLKRMGPSYKDLMINPERKILGRKSRRRSESYIAVSSLFDEIAKEPEPLELPKFFMF